LLDKIALQSRFTEMFYRARARTVVKVVHLGLSGLGEGRQLLSRVALQSCFTEPGSEQSAGSAIQQKSRRSAARLHLEKLKRGKKQTGKAAVHGFRVSGFLSQVGFRVPDSGFRVHCPGSRLSGAVCRDPGIRLQVSGFGCEGTKESFRDSGFGIRVPGFGIRDSDSGIRDSGFEIRVPRFHIQTLVTYKLNVLHKTIFISNIQGKV